MKIRNLTPHPIVINRTGMDALTIAPEPMVARVAEEFVPQSLVNGVTFGHSKYGAVIGLPSCEEGTILIVSSMVRAAASHRNDVFSPGLLIRDRDGHVIGCGGLVGRRRLSKDWPQA